MGFPQIHCEQGAPISGPDHSLHRYIRAHWGAYMIGYSVALHVIHCTQCATPQSQPLTGSWSSDGSV